MPFLQQLRIFFRDTVAVHRTHPMLSLIVWICSGLACGFVTLGDFPMFCLLTVLLASQVLYRMSLYKKLLEARMGAEGGGIVWDVRVNDVTVGCISDSRYAAIQRDVFFDGRLLGRQLFNFLQAVVEACLYLFRRLPAILFFSALGFFAVAPQDFMSVLNSLRTVTSDQVIAAIPLIERNFILISILFAPVVLVMKGSPSLNHEFVLACNAKVRREVGCPAMGPVWLSDVLNNTHRYPDGLEALWGSRRNQLAAD
jgi:hypothetical protein